MSAIERCRTAALGAHEGPARTRSIVLTRADE
jgi:hypothetical protein